MITTIKIISNYGCILLVGMILAGLVELLLRYTDMQTVLGVLFLTFAVGGTIVRGIIWLWERFRPTN